MQFPENLYDEHIFLCLLCVPNLRKSLHKDVSRNLFNSHISEPGKIIVVKLLYSKLFIKIPFLGPEVLDRTLIKYEIFLK